MDAFLWAKSKASETTIDPPIFGVPNKVTRFYFSGNPDSFLELATYDVKSKDSRSCGRLLLGEFDGTHEKWRKINGALPSLAADYFPAAIKVGDNIYLDSKDGYKIMAIDISKDTLQLSDYELGNRLLNQAKEMFGEQETSPMSFGTFSNDDVLLIAVGGNAKQWIWAIQNGQLVGKLFVSAMEKKLTIYRGEEIVGTESMPVVPDGLMMPQSPN
jgi:hypothetical protein